MDSIRAHRLRTNASTRLPSAVARRLSSPIPTVAPGSLRAVTRSGTSTPSRSVGEEVSTGSPTASVPTPEFYKSAKTLKKEARLAAGVSAGGSCVFGNMRLPNAALFRFFAPRRFSCQVK